MLSSSIVLLRVGLVLEGIVTNRESIGVLSLVHFLVGT
jgi:hypothetical protein